MNSNFQFLQKEFPAIFNEISDAEKHTFTAPRYAALLCRSTLEKTIFWFKKSNFAIIFITLPTYFTINFILYSFNNYRFDEELEEQ